MSNKSKNDEIRIICCASAHQDPSIPSETPVNCPHCGHATDDCEMGFGLAGGGYGCYETCAQCGRMLSKHQEFEE